MDTSSYSRSQRLEEVFEILYQYNSLFATFWLMGKPTFTDTLETAAIAWNLETKDFTFYFNPSFFDSLTDYELSFVIAHECLHVYFNHGERSAPLIPILANIALDISVNTILLDYFDFKEEELPCLKNAALPETIFPDIIVPRCKNFEYYYTLLLEKFKDQIKEAQELEDKIKEFFDSLQSLDDHSKSGSPESSKEGHKKLIEDVNNSVNSIDNDKMIQVSKNEIKELKSHSGGIGHIGEPLIPGAVSPHVEKKASYISPLWKELLRAFFFMNKEKDESSFIFKDRRHSLLGKNFLIPATIEVEKKKDLPQIFFFLDSSGSCTHYAPLFAELSTTIDRKVFDTKYYSRTTNVQEIKHDKDGNLIIGTRGGSDDFSCIERFIQGELTAGRIKKYPIVIHFTDGGDCSRTPVRPKHPEKWFHFMEHINVHALIPELHKQVYTLNQLKKRN